MAGIVTVPLGLPFFETLERLLAAYDWITALDFHIEQVEREVKGQKTLRLTRTVLAGRLAALEVINYALTLESVMRAEQPHMAVIIPDEAELWRELLSSLRHREPVPFRPEYRRNLQAKRSARMTTGPLAALPSMQSLIVKAIAALDKSREQEVGSDEWKLFTARTDAFWMPVFQQLAEEAAISGEHGAIFLANSKWNLAIDRAWELYLCHG